METYLVGGAVRDELLGLEVGERDWVVVGGSAEELEARGYRRVGHDFPVFLHPGTGEEYALARTERKSGHGYHGFEIHAGRDVTLTEDLARRDLTINAMARDSAGCVIDPWGGRADLAAGLLRHVSPAFSEDPLRVLRVARLAARLAPMGFTVAQETRALMRTMSATGELDWLVPERVWRETARALGEPAVVTYFTTLADCHALARVFPELAPQFTPAPSSIGASALGHACALTSDASIRLAALCAPGAIVTGRVETLAARLPIPRQWLTLAQCIAQWYERCLDLAPAASPIARLLDGLDALRRRERFEAILTACDALAAAHCTRDWPQKRRLLDQARAQAAALGGQPLAHEGWRGPALGHELQRRRTAAIARLLEQTQG